MNAEPIETLREIMEVELFAIEATKHLGPFGPEVDQVCYHLNNDVSDDNEHRDADAVHSALIAAGIQIEREALSIYPFEIWERRWPTLDWLKRDVPVMFDVLNRFGHGIYMISYEPRGAARDLYQAAFRFAWDNAAPEVRPSGCEQEDMSQKAASVIFHVKLRDAVYQAVRTGKVSVRDAVSRMNDMQDHIRERWPDKAAEARMLGSIGDPSFHALIPEFGPEHAELLNWALWHITTDPIGKAN